MTSEGSVSMNIDSNREKESLNEDKAIHYVVLHEGQILLKDNVLKVETIDNNGNDVTAQDQGILQVQQQLKPQGTVVCWERLLHVRSIRVLLVENDDATRHVVTALLRNCNYEVVKASNGLQAWKILEDLTNHIDLVLTEVVIPCVLGIDLLCKITSHETRKNIPVVMMSSHDSMRLVFKCLSKGAVDFLVKPIRKNELKNLWQHVWRRCHSSSGSGNESGTQTRKPVKSNSRDKFDNSGSYDGGNNESNGLDVGDGSDDGSDAQSSWTKVEVGSSQARSPADHLAEFPDSSCAQDTFSNAETAANKMIPVRRAKA
ncbi:Two-component response regulator-like APRR7 [Abeliophyllum distichum]|uniref:Two-component response regulator-like APRR7 n=1 Tax=Abeliophyllum distichum TaxID=126358 RepID=A0ABD1V8M9_9LAMI